MNANLGCLPKTSMTACSSSRRWTILEIYNASLASMMWAFHPSIQYLMSYKWYISYNLRRLQYIVWDELFLVCVGLKSLPVILGKIQTKHHYGPVNEWQPINHLKFQPNSTDLPKIIPPCFVDRMFVANCSQIRVHTDHPISSETCFGWELIPPTRNAHFTSCFNSR